MPPFATPSVLALLRERLRDRVPRREDVPGYRHAAVLLPLVDRAGAMHLAFTLRSPDLPTHSGQVSFPGGKVEASDASHVAAALREAEEEVGLAPSQVEVIGRLDDELTPSGFVICPVVGVVAPGALLRAASREVVEAFDVSLGALAAPGVFRDMGDVERVGRTFRLVAYEVDGRNIWGATARMVSRLLELAGEPQELADA